MASNKRRGRPRQDTGKPQSTVPGVYYRDDGKPQWVARIRWVRDGQAHALQTRAWPVNPKARRGDPTNLTTARLAAEAWATAEWEALDRKGMPRSKLPTVWTFGQILEDYLDGLEAGTIKPKAVQTEKSACRILLGRATGRTPNKDGFPHLTRKYLSDLTPDDFLSTADGRASLRQMMKGPDGGEVNLATLRRTLNVLRSVFKHAIEVRGIDFHNPLATIKGLNVDDSRERVLEGDEWDKILAALRGVPRHKGTRPGVIDATIFTRYAATRRGETVKLDWDDVDLVKRTALLRDTKSRSRTKPRDRTIPLPQEAWAILLARAHQAWGGEAQINWMALDKDELAKHAERLSQLRPGDVAKRPIFTNGKGGRLRADAITQAWNDARERAGLGKGSGKTPIRIHDLRHTRITELASGNDLSPTDVARISGHSDLNMLMRYFNPTPEDMVSRIDVKARRRQAPSEPGRVDRVVDLLMELEPNERSQVMARLMQRLGG